MPEGNASMRLIGDHIVIIWIILFLQFTPGNSNASFKINKELEFCNTALKKISLETIEISL